MITSILPTSIKNVDDGKEYFLITDKEEDGVTVKYVWEDSVLIICKVSNMVPTRTDIDIIRKVFITLKNINIILVRNNYTESLKEFVRGLKDYEDSMYGDSEGANP